MTDIDTPKFSLHLKADAMAEAARRILDTVSGLYPEEEINLSEAIQEYQEEKDSFVRNVELAMGPGLAKHLFPEILNYLNRLRDKNPKALHDLCEYRVDLEMDPDDDEPPIVVSKKSDGPGYHFGLIGILNGMTEHLVAMGRFRIAGFYNEDDMLVKFGLVDTDKASQGISNTG